MVQLLSVAALVSSLQVNEQGLLDGEIFFGSVYRYSCVERMVQTT